MDFVTTKSVIDAVSLEAIAAFVQQELIAKPQLASTVTDLSAMVGPGMDLIKIPRFGSFVAERKVGALALSAQKLDPTNDSLLLDKHDAVYTMVENIAQLQSSVNIQELYAQRIASALMKKWDEEIYTELKLASSSSPDHLIAYDSGSTITKGDFTNAIELLLLQNIDISVGQLTAALPVAQYKAALELADFVDADKWMSGSEAVKANGALGRAYGFNIIVSTIFDSPVFYHSSALAFARQQALEFMQVPAPKYLAVELSAAHIYGCKQLQGGKGAVVVS